MGLRRRLKYKQFDAFDVATAISEACQNTFDHNSNTCGFIAMQVYGHGAKRFLEIGRLFQQLHCRSWKDVFFSPVTGSSFGHARRPVTFVPRSCATSSNWVLAIRWVIDAKGVEVFDYSFANELFGKLILALPAEYPDRFLVVENLTTYTRENLTKALEGMGRFR